MFKSFMLLLVCTFGLTYFVSAQNAERKFYGVIKDSITLTPIANAAIHNKTGKKATYSNENGLFQLMTHAGDTIFYYAPGFMDGHYVVQDSRVQMDTVEIWLKPKVKEDLPGVFVSTYTYKDYQADSAQRMKEFVEEVGLKLPTFSKSNSGAGLGIGLDGLFSKKNKQKKKAYETFKDDEEQRYIDFRFNKVLIHNYSGLKGAKLSEFMSKYRPTYDWLRENTDAEALKYYINDRLKLYFQRVK